MAKLPHDRGQRPDSDPVQHLTSGIEPFIRAIARPRRRSQTNQREQGTSWAAIALIAGLTALSIVSIWLMFGRT